MLELSVSEEIADCILLKISLDEIGKEYNDIHSHLREGIYGFQLGRGNKIKNNFCEVIFMYERMLNKMNVPTKAVIQETIGMEALDNLNQYESFLMELYDLDKELKFPFGKNYGWGYKYRHKSKHLCYLFFEQGGFTIFTQIGDKQVSEMENKLVFLSDKAKEIWSSRYPCGEYGGWINYRVLREEDIMEVLEFIKIKVKPIVVTNK